jgi:hypothetical protein
METVLLRKGPDFENYTGVSKRTHQVPAVVQNTVRT